MTVSAPTGEGLLARYEDSLLGVFGRPQLVLERGEGCHVWDVDGRRYLDLLGGIAVNALGHAHPAVVAAATEAAGRLLHVSNFFTTPAQVALAERLLEVSGAPEGSAVFFANSGSEAMEAAIKVTRRTGRPGLLAAQGAFHGRTTGAVALTHKAAYREPFEPLLPGVLPHVPYGDADALRAAFAAHGDEIAAFVVEPVQGEGGVVTADPEYLRAAREITREHGALLVLDEVQTGIGRTGRWFGFQESGIVPDVVTVAKGLGGGVPIGAMLTFGSGVSALLGPGQHGSTFGGNPFACAVGLAVLDVVERDGLLAHAAALGGELRERLAAVGHPGVAEVRGAGLLIGIGLTEPVSSAVAAAALRAGFIVNPVRPDTIRLAPPLVLTADEADSFVDALPGLLDAARRS